MTVAHRSAAKRRGQLALPGFETAGAIPLADAWFFAVRPTPAAIAAIERLPERVQARSMPGTRPIAPARLHVSLQGIDVVGNAAAGDVARAREAAVRVHAGIFTLAFDRFATFGRGAGQRPFVLMTSGAAEDLRSLYRELGAALAATGVKQIAAHPYTPHLTLAYGTPPIATAAVEPVCWIVDEFVLVRSLQGRSRHVIEGRWRLAAR